MVYVVANLYLFHGLLKFIYDHGKVIKKELAYENGDTIAKAGSVKHPKERVRMLARMTSELGLIDETDENFVLTPSGESYVTMMPENIWNISAQQSEFLREHILNKQKETRLSKTIIAGLDLLKKYKRIKPDVLKDEFAEKIGRLDWDKITRMDKLKFVLNYIVDMRLAKREKGEFYLVEGEQKITGVSIICDRVQKRPSPEVDSLGQGQSILIVKDSYIARNTLLYPAHSSATSNQFKDVQGAQEIIDLTKGKEINLEYFIYPVKIYKLKNKPEVAKFAAQYQPWTQEIFEEWRQGKNNIIVAILRVYKTNPIKISSIGNMGIVPLPTPIKVTELTPVLSDEQFSQRVNEVEIALREYDLIQEEKPVKSVYKMSPGAKAEYWEECRNEGLISGGWDETDDNRDYQNKEEFRKKFGGNISSREINNAWTFYKEMSIGDIVVANRGISEIVGIGKITSDYIYDPGRKEYKQVRRVKWVITDSAKIPFNFPIWTLSSINQENWKAIKDTYIKLDKKYDQIFAELEYDIHIEIEPYKTEGITSQMGAFQLLAHLHDYISAKGFIYSKDDVANFYLSLKTKPFVILAGISGTGKSKLVELFAEAVGANTDNDQYMLIPVRPDWNDCSDLLGYKNINGDFLPGPLTRIIKKASAQPDKPFFVCLDEMNLSRVEYYFSDILSLMETKKKTEKGYFSDRIFKSDYFVHSADRKEYGELRLPPNLYIIGTVNMDETTFPFSKKVLDRANTLEFSTVNLNTLPDGNLVSLNSLCIGNDLLTSRFITLKECLTNLEYIKSVNEKLEEINKVLEKANLHVGYRVRDEICFYMTYNKEFKLLNDDDAFDYQLSQKILPRIQGSSNLISTVLIELFKIATKQDYSKIDSGVGDVALTYIQDNSVKPYPRSAKKIATMLWRFEDGFTSFWI